MLVLSRIGYPAHHPVQTKVMHRIKGAIEEDERESEMNFSPGFIHHPPKHFREPEINRPEDAEEAASEQHIVDVRNNEVGVMDEQIDWSRSHEDSTQASN